MRRLLLLLAVLGFAAFSLTARPAAAAGRNFVVFFQSWSAALDQPALETIAAAARMAKEKLGASVTVTAFAGPVGSRQANVYLTETRAQVVTDQLTADGVAAERIRQHAAGIVPYQLTDQESRRVVIAVGGP